MESIRFFIRVIPRYSKNPVFLVSNIKEVFTVVFLKAEYTGIFNGIYMTASTLRNVSYFRPFCLLGRL